MPNGLDGDGPLGPNDGPIQGRKVPDSFAKRYWPFFIGVPVVVLLGVIGLNEYSPFMCFGDDCWKVDADKVTADASNKLTGRFRFITGGIFDSIHSTGKGGACLFVESAALDLPSSMTAPGGKCVSDEQCGGLIEDDPTTKADDDFVGWEGVCHRKTSTCWIRPGPGFPFQTAVCNKGVDARNAWQFSNTIPFDPSTLKSKLKASAKNKPVNFRILACLNGKVTPAQVSTPCGGGPGRKITQFSDPPNAFSMGQ